jgi:phosphoglycolate phosphatase
MAPDSAISTGSAVRTALSADADAADHGQPVRLAVLAMVGTTVHDGGLMDQAMSRTLVEQGVPAGSARFEDMLRYARERSGISRMTVFAELFDDPQTATSANRRFELNCDELIADIGVRAVPGAEDAIGWLRDTGIKVYSGLRAGASVAAGVLTGSNSEAALRSAGATDVVPSIKDFPALLERRASQL